MLIISGDGMQRTHDHRFRHRCTRCQVLSYQQHFCQRRLYCTIQSWTVWLSAPSIRVELSETVRRRLSPAFMPILENRIQALSQSPSTWYPFSMTVVQEDA